MTQITKESIIDALRQIKQESSDKDIISLEMISDIIIRDGNVGFAIEIAPQDGENSEPLRLACEEAVQSIPGVLSVTAVLTAERAKSEAPNNISPSKPQKNDQTIPGITSILAVASGKGGVGKSTTAVNISVAIAKTGMRVGLLDCDVYGPSVPRLMRISGKPDTTPDSKLIPIENYGVKCMSMGFLVEEDTPMIWRGPMVMSALEQMLRDVKWGELDILVCDLPPGTGDAQLTMAQRVPLTGAIIVSTPQDIALLDVRRGISMFERVDVPVFGIVENMSYFVCPSCGERSEIFSHGGARETASEIGVEFLGEIPLAGEIRQTSDDGKPIIVAKPESPHTKAYSRIAEHIVNICRSAEASGDRSAPKIIMM